MPFEGRLIDMSEMSMAALSQKDALALPGTSSSSVADGPARLEMGRTTQGLPRT